MKKHCDIEECNGINSGIDPCIQKIIKALNDGGIETVASCCGHGNTIGSIILKDGREFIIAPDYETARKIEQYWPDIHGEWGQGIEGIVDRFLTWKLPKDFHPDAGIEFTPPPEGSPHQWPTGTNLLDANQAARMVKAIVGYELRRLQAAIDELAVENERLQGELKVREAHITDLLEALGLVEQRKDDLAGATEHAMKLVMKCARAAITERES